MAQTTRHIVQRRTTQAALTPERMTVVAVGDVNPDEIEERIMETFKDMTPHDEDYRLDEVELGSVNTQGTGFEAACQSKPLGENPFPSRPSR